jgi:hypothetical protein
VAGLETVEVPADHRTGEAAADRGADDIDELTGTKWLGTSSAPTSRTASFATRNSTSFFFGSTLALGEVTAHRLGHVLHLGLAVAELHGDVLVLLFRADSDNLQLIHLQNGDGTCSPASLKTRVMPTFWVTRPQRMVFFLLSWSALRRRA